MLNLKRALRAPVAGAARLSVLAHTWAMEAAFEQTVRG